jgi:diguanylate cyclase (GGDEF)-like protein/PAS domain S-box-containing protein
LQRQPRESRSGPASAIDQPRPADGRYAFAARGAKDGLWEWNLERDELLLSSRWSSLLGLEEAERSTTPAEWLERIHPADRSRVREQLSSATSGGSNLFESEHRLAHEDGRYLWVLARGEVTQGKNGGASRIAGSLTDITQQKLAEDRLRHEATHDELTGLPNRSTFMEHLRRLLQRSRRSRRDLRFAVLFLDFDRFKRINDSLGHLAGDQLLAAISRRLKDCVRPGDTVARLGGDEFGVILERLGDVTEATRVAERIHQALRDPFPIQGLEVLITTSIGIAVGSRACERPMDLLRDADTAMYRAKAAGKGRHEVFDSAMQAHAVEQLQLESDLRRAMDRDEIRLLYQPVVALHDRSIVGFEALARWKHPTRGLLPPSAFLPAAEETGLIVELGFQVLRKSCFQIQRWQQGPRGRRSLSIHVNVSDKQLFHPDLADRVEQVLGETELQPGELVLDVSENVVMQKADLAVAILGQLKSLGLQIHLDDFGTGYSSLGYLHRFEIDTLKIDRSFIRNLRAGGDNWIAARTIMGLADNLGMGVIAEGVETEEQLQELLGLGCTLGQGSLFHEPLSPELVDDILG